MKILGKTRSDLYKELKKFMKVDYPTVCRSLDFDLQTLRTQRVRRQIEFQILIWEHHEEEKRKEWEKRWEQRKRNAR